MHDVACEFRAQKQLARTSLKVLISIVVLEDIITSIPMFPELSYLPDLGYVTTKTSSCLVWKFVIKSQSNWGSWVKSAGIFIPKTLIFFGDVHWPSFTWKTEKLAIIYHKHCQKNFVMRANTQVCKFMGFLCHASVLWWCNRPISEVTSGHVTLRTGGQPNVNISKREE